MASIASSLQFVQSTIKDTVAAPKASGIRSAFGQLALGLATAAGAIGIASLAKKTGATFEPVDRVGAGATAQEEGRAGGGPAAPRPQEPKPAGQKAQNVLLIAGVSVFALAVILWAVAMVKQKRKGR